MSTDEQRLGPEAQRATIEVWAAREGVTISAWHVDQGVSGAAEVADRPALVQALADLRELGAGVLVIAKRDRIARDVVIAQTIERATQGAGARLVSADGTGNGDSPADAFMRTVLDGHAAYERALIRARTKAALAVKSRRGEHTGGHAPFGWRVGSDGVRLERDGAEQRTIARARELRASGLTLRAVSAALASEGLVSRASTPFAPLAVSNMVGSVTALAEVNEAAE